MQPLGNIFSYFIANEINQQLIQHTVGHTLYKKEGKQYTYYPNENGGWFYKPF